MDLNWITSVFIPKYILLNSKQVKRWSHLKEQITFMNVSEGTLAFAFGSWFIPVSLSRLFPYLSLTSRRLFLFDTQPYLRRRLVQGCWICRYFYYSPCIHERFWLNCETLFWYKFSWLFLTPGETLLWDPESVRMWPPSTFACSSLTLVVFSSCWPFFKLKLYSLLEHIVDFFLWYIGKEAKTSLLQMVSFTKMTISLGKFCLFSRNSRI